MSGCKYLSDSSIQVLAEFCKDIYHLNLTRIPQFTEAGLVHVAKAGLSNLEYLNLYANSNIADSGFMTFAAESGCKKLQFLDLCGCKFLSDESAIQISISFPELRFLNLTWCVALNDSAMVDGVAKHLTKLDLLSIYGLTRMSDKAVEALIDSPLRQTLRTLDINGCKAVTKYLDDQELRVIFPNVTCTVFHS